MDRGAWWATVHGVTESQTEVTEHTRTDPPLVPEWLCWFSGESHSIPQFHEIVIWWDKLAYSVPGVFGLL